MSSRELEMQTLNRLGPATAKLSWKREQQARLLVRQAESVAEAGSAKQAGFALWTVTPRVWSLAVWVWQLRNAATPADPYHLPDRVV